MGLTWGTTVKIGPYRLGAGISKEAKQRLKELRARRKEESDGAPLPVERVEDEVSIRRAAEEDRENAGS